MEGAKSLDIGEAAFDYETFAQQYERTVKQLLRCELRSMNGDGASMKVVPVISFVVGDSGEASTREDDAENSLSTDNMRAMCTLSSHSIWD